MGSIVIRALLYTLLLLFSFSEFITTSILIADPEQVLNDVFLFFASVFGFMSAVWTVVLIIYRERTKTSRPLFPSSTHFGSCVALTGTWLTIAVMLTSHLPLSFQCEVKQPWCDYAYISISLAWALYGISTASAIFNYFQSTEIADEEARNMKFY